MADERPPRVGDFVSVRGSRERLGRVERIEGEWYQVRMLLPHRRWAVQTTGYRAEGLATAGHDFVRARLGLEVSEPLPPGASEPSPEPSPTVATRSLPRREVMARASPALERSLSTRVLGARAAAGEAEVGDSPEREPEPELPPMAPGGLSELFSRVSFQGTFRRFQAQALEAFERSRAAGRRRSYLVMPSGSGKTVLGLEIARRLGNRTLCLVPNPAVRAQWIRQWEDFQPAIVSAGTDAGLSHHLTTLTFQAVCDIDPHSPEGEEQVAILQAGDTGDRYLSADPLRRARLLAAQGGSRQELMALLNPGGRRLVDRLASEGPWTLVLDECHHLLETWGHLLPAIVDELGPEVFVVGLTATPPSELDAGQAELHRALFGRADLEVAAPAVVKEGNLAPYQELVYLTSPLDSEAEYIESERVRFEGLVAALHDPSLGTVSFLEWFRRRFVERASPGGVEAGWAELESAHPRLARAALRYCFGSSAPPPPGARFREGDREPPAADDWIYLIDDYCVGHLRTSEEPADLAAWEMIRSALPGLGYSLGYHGVRSHLSPVDRVLLLSGSKLVAAREILAAEERALGPRLRALLLCDFEAAGAERPGRLRGILDPAAGSAALALRALLADPAARRLAPILVTARTVACSRATAADLGDWLEIEFETRGEEGGAGSTGAEREAVEIRPRRGAWEAGDYLPLIARYFEEGRSRCLVGTRGLLGEGWDAASVNVTVDLTGVTTTTAVHQLRGRSLRLDPELPRKVADNWDVVCVAPEHPMGLTDYSRFVRKHRDYYGLTETGEIESGVSHVDARLSSFGPPPREQLAELNARLLDRPALREEVYARWRVGAPYQNLPTRTVRVRFDSFPGLARNPLRADVAGVDPPPSIMGRLIATLLAGTGAYGLGLALHQDLIGLEVGLVLIALGLGWTAGTVRRYLEKAGPAPILENLAAAVADGLAGAGLVRPEASAASIRVVAQPDGFFRCYPAGASPEDSATFATAFEEVLSPLERPRFLVPRHVARPPRSTLGALGVLVLESSRPRRGDATVYHAVPSVLAVSRDRAEIFGRAWNRHVGAGEPLFQEDPRAQAIIELQRGEDPFDVLTQVRTLWE